MNAHTCTHLRTVKCTKLNYLVHNYI